MHTFSASGIPGNPHPARSQGWSVTELQVNFFANLLYCLSFEGLLWLPMTWVSERVTHISGVF